MRRKKRARGAKSPQSVSSWKQNQKFYLLEDNVHPGVIAKFARGLPNSTVVRKSDLGLGEAVADDELISAFCRSAAHTLDTHFIVFSKDAGAADGVMPRVVEKNRERGVDIRLVTYSPMVSSTMALNMADDLLAKRTGFFNPHISWIRITPTTATFIRPKLSSNKTISIKRKWSAAKED